jgi:hypothetical protein
MLVFNLSSGELKSAKLFLLSVFKKNPHLERIFGQESNYERHTQALEPIGHRACI